MGPGTQRFCVPGSFMRHPSPLSFPRKAVEKWPKGNWLKASNPPLRRPLFTDPATRTQEAEVRKVSSKTPFVAKTATEKTIRKTNRRILYCKTDFVSYLCEEECSQNVPHEMEKRDERQKKTRQLLLPRRSKPIDPSDPEVIRTPIVRTGILNSIH